MIDIGYALIRHRDPALPAARGTVVFNPGGPAGDVISGAAQWAELLAGLLADHDLLLIDPRGTGRSHALSCGFTRAAGDARRSRARDRPLRPGGWGARRARTRRRRPPMTSRRCARSSGSPGSICGACRTAPT